MELQDIELDEISPFFESLGRETELVMMNADAVKTSCFIAGIRKNQGLVGITGIRKNYGFIPDLFIVVKHQYQGYHFGEKLMEINLRFATTNYSFLILSTYMRQEYEAAIHLYKKHGFKDLFCQGDHCWMYISFNIKGKLICRILPYILPILPFLSYLVTGKLFKIVYGKILKKKKKKTDGNL